MSGASVFATTTRGSGFAGRWAKPVCAGLAFAIAVVAAMELIANLSYVLPPGDSSLGMDFLFYRELAARWLETGLLPAPPAERPLHGNADGRQPVPAAGSAPVPSVPGSARHPVVAHSRCRPGRVPRLVSPRTARVAPPRPCPRGTRTQTAFLFGNTDLWMAAAVAGGIRWGWPAALLVIKPTFLPFAIVGVRRREFWIALAVVAIVSIPMAALWLDYVQAIRNMTIDADYSVGSLPSCLPVVAWLLDARAGWRTEGPRPDACRMRGRMPAFSGGTGGSSTLA